MIIRKRVLEFATALSCTALLALATHAGDSKDSSAAVTLAPPEPIIEVYDIHALVIPLLEFPLDTSPHAPAFTLPPNRQPHDERDSEDGVALYREHSPAHENLGEQVIDVVKEAVAPDSWRDAGGTLGAIKESQGLLIVRQSPANQKAIAGLLKKMEDERFTTIRTTAEWVVLPTNQIEKLLQPLTGGDAADPVREINREALEKLPATARRYHANLLSRNSQTVHFISGREQTVAVNQKQNKSTEVAAFTPDIGNIAGGIALQINPTVDRQAKRAVVTIFSTFNDPEKPGEPVGVLAMATTQPATGVRIVVSEAAATYRPVAGVVQEIRTTARLPLGVPVLVGSMTLKPMAGESVDQQLALILTIHAGQ